MSSANGIKTDNNVRGNNFSLLRLVFAILVIVGHSPELIDGDRSRDFLVRISGSLFSGDVAVDGFFLISGYLIFKSFESSSSIKDYIFKRIVRIYPGFISAFLATIFIFGPLAGGFFMDIPVIKTAVKLIVLGLPSVPGAFSGLAHPEMNGSMWTISYEFRCYIMVIIIGLLLRRKSRIIYIILILIMAILYAIRGSLPDIPYGSPIFGSTNASVRLTFIFLIGAGFYIWRDKITLSDRGAVLAGVAFVCLMFVPPLAEPAFAGFGGYVIFWFAFSCRPYRISEKLDRVDPSYGVYLYAWPIQNSLIYHFHDVSPWFVAIVTLPISLIFGLLSWNYIEMPFLRQKSSYSKSSDGRDDHRSATLTRRPTI